MAKNEALCGTPAEGYDGSGNFPGWFRQVNTTRFQPVDPDKAHYIHRRLREGRTTPPEYAQFGQSREAVDQVLYPQRFAAREMDRLSSVLTQEQFAALSNFQPSTRTGLGIALGFTQAEMIGDELLPLYVGGPDLKADYPSFGTEMFNLVNTLKTFGQKSGRVDIKIDWTTVTCDMHHLETPVEQAEREAGVFLPMGLDTVKTEVLRGLVNLEKENEQFTFLSTAGNYATGHSTTLSSTSQWSDPSSDPITDVWAAKSKVRKMARSLNTKMWMGPDVLTALIRNPKVIDAVKYTGTKMDPGGIVPPATLVNLFMVPIIVGYAGVSATFGASPTDLWSQHAGLVVTGEGQLIAQRFGITVTTAGYPSFTAYQDRSVGSKGATIYKYANAWKIPASPLNNAAAFLWKNASKSY